ncbi:MAG TPA: hypothetical protein VF137_05665 [Candidatus Dormibacteraeota bacterium]
MRRLDDILEALEQLNLHDERTVPLQLLERLHEVGVRDPETLAIPQLIEAVWALQQPYLIQLLVDRRRRRRRKEIEAAAGGEQSVKQAG